MPARQTVALSEVVNFHGLVTSDVCSILTYVCPSKVLPARKFQYRRNPLPSKMDFFASLWYTLFIIERCNHCTSRAIDRTSIPNIHMAHTRVARKPGTSSHVDVEWLAEVDQDLGMQGVVVHILI